MATYFYSKDTKPNDAYGQGFNKVRFVVNPSASQFMKLESTQSGYSSSGVNSSG